MTLNASLKVALAGTVLAVAPLQATLTAPGHTPRINTHWRYAVHATRGGKPVAATLTVQLVDPIGGRHPVELGSTTKKIVSLPFKGVFRDYVIFPPESRGVPLKLRLVVRAGGTTKILTYAVTPRA